MAHLISFLSIIIAMHSFYSVNGIFLHMRHTEEKCFIEEIPYETLILVGYKLEIWDPSHTAGAIVSAQNRSNVSSDPDLVGLGLKVLVKDPKGAVIMEKTYGREGRFAFTSHMAGDHIICLSSNDTTFENLLRLHLSIKIGGYAVDYDVVSKKEKLTALQLQIRKIQDLTDQIRKEQDYQRTREKRFRQTSDSTNSRVIFFAVIQTILLIVVSVYQVRHLKMFFIVKKLV